MKKLLLAFVFISTMCHGQLQNTWMLGHFVVPGIPKSGIDFSNGSADTFSIFRPMPFIFTNSIISDDNGQIQFYSNGIYIANRNNDTLFNSNNFNPGYKTTSNQQSGLVIPQALVILPFDAINPKYTIIHCSGDTFTLNAIQYRRPLNLRSSEVDMTLDNGLGGITNGKKGVVILNDTLNIGFLTACRHANGRDWWVLSHKLLSDQFYNFLVTPDTVIIGQQSIGSIPLADNVGQAQFSPDGAKYAFMPQSGQLDIYDFDRCSGVLYNHQPISVPDTILGYLGASFSPNSRYLYINTNLAIYQYDMMSANINNSVQTVALWDTVVSIFNTYFGASQLGPDGKIYIGTFNGCNVLHCITSPNSGGMACNVQQNVVKLPTANIFIPTYPNYGLGALAGSPCDTLTGLQTINTNTTQLNLFPNPATNYLNITYQFKTNEQALFTLYNSMGQEVVCKTLYGTFKSLMLHTNTYNAGLYYYKVVMKNKMVQTGKLVIGR